MDSLTDSNLDDILRTALTLADRGLIPHESSREWYGQVVLGELSAAEFLVRIEKGVHDPVLARHVALLMDDVPFQGSALHFQRPLRAPSRLLVGNP